MKITSMLFMNYQWIVQLAAVCQSSNNPLPSIDIIKVWNIGQIERIPPWKYNTKLTKLRSGWGRSLPRGAHRTESNRSPSLAMHAFFFGSRSPWWRRGIQSSYLQQLSIFNIHLIYMWISEYTKSQYVTTCCILGAYEHLSVFPLISTSLIPLHPKFSPGFVGRSQLGTERVHNGWKRCH